jgi:serine/threonine protein kinase
VNFLSADYPQLSKNLLENFWSGWNTVRVHVDPVAPEVLKGKKYTQAADIYSFGILACEILSVQLSFMLAQCFIRDVIFVCAYTGNELQEVQ